MSSRTPAYEPRPQTLGPSSPFGEATLRGGRLAGAPRHKNPHQICRSGPETRSGPRPRRADMLLPLACAARQERKYRNGGDRAAAQAVRSHAINNALRAARADSVLGLVDQPIGGDPGHHGAQLGADVLDRMLGRAAARGLEAGLAGIALLHPV